MKQLKRQSTDFYQNIDYVPPKRGKYKGSMSKKSQIYLPLSGRGTMKKYFLKRLIFPSVVLFLIIVIALLSLSTAVSEFFAVTVARGVAYILSCTGSLFSFHLFDFLLITIACILIVLLITAIVLYCVKKAHTASFLMIFIINVILCFVLLFQLSAGSIYNRKSIEDGLNIPYAASNTITKNELYGAADYFINEINKINEIILRDNRGRMYNPLSLNNMSLSMNTMLNGLNKNNYLHKFAYRPKMLVTSNISSAFGISGITMPLTGEIGINMNTFDYTLPMTIAHELAHSKGVMTENQANALALHVCINGGREFKYSAYSTIVNSLIYSIYQLDGIEVYREYYNKINADITKEWALYSDYLEQYDGFFNDVGEFFNNIYLKINGVKTGTFNYSELDGYIIGIYRNKM